MALKDKLDRRVRAHARAESDQSDQSDQISSSLSDEGRENGSDSDSEQGSESESSSHNESEVPGLDDIGSISFGALAKAQRSLNQKPDSEGNEAEDSIPRERTSHSTKISDKAHRPSRSSKHAPAEQSSKYPVTRRREALPVSVREKGGRDPRFSSLSGRMDETALKRNYAFLNEYQDAEMAELRDAVRKTRDESVKDTLKRKLLSMESRRKTEQNEQRRLEVQQEHRRKEKELVKEGKKPFYLKRGQVKELADEAKLGSLKSKQREKLLERRRKKVTQRERRNMPLDRRQT